MPSLFDSFEGVAKNDVFGNYRGDMGREKKNSVYADTRTNPDFGLFLPFHKYFIEISSYFKYMYDPTNVYFIKYLFVY